MENYNQMVQENHHHHTSSSNNKNSRSNFSPYQDAGTPLGMTTTPSHHHHHHHHHHMNMNDSGGGSTGGGGGDYFQSALVAAAAAAAAGEDNSSNSIAKNERSQQATRFYNYPLLTSSGEQQQHLQFHQQVGGGRDQHVPSSRGRDCEMLGIVGSNNNGNRRSGNEDNNAGDQREVEVMKAKIIAHPQYPNLLQAYADCQKVGAPPDVAARLTVIRQEFETRQKVASSSSPACSSKDPELDQFMEAYYDMLVKYREELTRPVQEAIEFMSRVEAQLHLLTDGRSRVFNSDEKSGANAGSSEEEPENSGGETELPEIDPRAEDRELKNHLLRKYSGYLSSLKQELSKKKKKGKLPKEARQKLLSWWELHYKWPYPSESEKVALAEATGLDQKQINNWFINQRKRHWKPSEDMQFMVMDGIHPQNAALYMEGHYLGDGPYRFGT